MGTQRARRTLSMRPRWSGWSTRCAGERERIGEYGNWKCGLQGRRRQRKARRPLAADDSLLIAGCAIMRQAAEELGHWVTKSESRSLNISEIAERLNTGRKRARGLGEAAGVHRGDADWRVKRGLHSPIQGRAATAIRIRGDGRGGSMSAAAPPMVTATAPDDRSPRRRSQGSGNGTPRTPPRPGGGCHPTRTECGP